MVDRGGLENRCGPTGPPWVRIPPSPLCVNSDPCFPNPSCVVGYGLSPPSGCLFVRNCTSARTAILTPTRTRSPHSPTPPQPRIATPYNSFRPYFFDLTSDTMYRSITFISRGMKPQEEGDREAYESLLRKSKFLSFWVFFVRHYYRMVKN